MNQQDILQFFPERLQRDWSRTGIAWNELTELRLRVNRPAYIRTLHREIAHVIYREKDIDDIFRHLCHDSVYAYEQERRQGYMTLAGGHRVGFTGEVVYADGGWIVRNIRYLNIRIAHEITGLAQALMPYLYENGEPCDTLLLSPPAVGKTTLLRDIIRCYADGNGEHAGVNVGVIDERGELAGAYRGSASLDCGRRADILTGGNKPDGVSLLVRTFAPRIVAMDEIGGEGDARAIRYASVSGCAVLATAHGASLADVRYKQLPPFERYLLLERMPSGQRTVRIYDGEGRELCGQKQLRASSY